MRQLNTYQQPHYDPSVLTINLHLSPANFHGCSPEDNGLRVFSSGDVKGESIVYPTPQGTAVFIWEDAAKGASCLHMANPISQGCQP
mmetsp:Transcript_10612/g.24880  ORF Transcript_10612/g.24880 Transcript_10612/m.24880 type:complete len:87 (-) Transcript_10612:6-266(-)